MLGSRGLMPISAKGLKPAVAHRIQSVQDPQDEGRNGRTESAGVLSVEKGSEGVASDLLSCSKVGGNACCCRNTRSSRSWSTALDLRGEEGRSAPQVADAAAREDSRGGSCARP